MSHATTYEIFLFFYRDLFTGTENIYIMKMNLMYISIIKCLVRAHTNCFCNIEDIYRKKIFGGAGPFPFPPVSLQAERRKNCKMYLRNFLFVSFFPPSFFSQTSFMYTLPILQASPTDNYVYILPFSKKWKKKQRQWLCAVAVLPRQSMEIVYGLQCGGERKKKNPSDNAKRGKIHLWKIFLNKLFGVVVCKI